MSNPMTHDSRELMLPKWAQQTINSLRRRVEDADRRAEDARLATKPEETDTIVGHRIADGVIGLRRGATVTFLPHPGADEMDWRAIQVRTFEGGIQIHGMTNISVSPVSANGVEIKAVPR